MGRTKWRVGVDGFLELVDEETGHVLERQKRPDKVKDSEGKPVRVSPRRGRSKKEDNETHHYIRDSKNRKVWVPKGTSADHIPRYVYPYAQVTHDLICAKVMEGYTVKEIGKMQGFPPDYVIYSWVSKYPEFAADVKKAKKMRAEIFADEVIGIARSTSKDTVLEDRLKSELLKWGAEVGDPEQFGKKTKITGDARQPVAFLIDTGIRRAEDGSASEVQIPADVPLSDSSSAGNDGEGL